MSTEESHLETRASHPAARLVHQALADMHDARREYRQMTVLGHYNRNVHQRFESMVVSAYDELFPYRTGATNKWENTKLDLIPKLANKTEPVDNTNNSGGVMSTSNDEPERTHVLIPGEDLVTFSHSIDECAREIGFTVDFGEEDVQSPDPF